MSPRILTGLFAHETNTFSVQPADVPAFRAMLYVDGPDFGVKLAHTNTEIAGFLQAADAFGWTVVPTVAAFANPCGKVTDAAWDAVGGQILRAARSEGPFDGVLVALHGAMVTDTYDDAEGAFLEQLRAIVGPDVPVAVTLDLHANVSPLMAAMADILVSYRTYPHIDMRERGMQAGELLHRAMARQVRPKTVLARRAMLQGVDGGRTDAGPMVELLRRVDAIEAADPGVLAISINAGFAMADIDCVGPSVTVTGDGDDPRFQAIAEDLMDRVWETRGVVTNTYLTPAEAAAVARARTPDGRPLVIADYADNPGAGAYGDATNLLAAMLDAGLENAAFGCVRDAEAAAALHGAGLNAEVTLAVGGKVDPRFGGPPLMLTGTVVHLSDGRFVCDGPMWAGIAKSLGPSAVLRVGGIDILVATNLLQVIDLQTFIANGIDPRAKDTVALKSMQHFRAAFEPIAARVIVADSGALASPDHSGLPYTRVPRPIWPLDAGAGPRRDGR
ncbi:MAG: M81 family metallopeptidase [Rhodospirillaceae bacterium]|nr:M81 family metallopeptidase [Rhodospirillaceae bacterium]